MYLADILFLLVVGITLCMMVYLAIWSFFERRREKKLLERVRKIDLGEGVTLSQGIRAYFGEEGDWYAGGEDLVRIFAGVKPPTTAFHIEIRHTESGEELFDIRVLGNGEKDRDWLDEDGIQALKNAMVRAVKDHGEFPEA